MKLSTLVNYRNQLEQLNIQPMQTVVNQNLDHVIDVAARQAMTIGNFVPRFKENKNQINQSIVDFQSNLDLLISEVEHLIDEVEKSYFLQSYKLYENDFAIETLEDLRNRSPNLLDNTKNFYKGRITRYIGWQHPAMIIRPAFEDLIQDMVACDPLYLIDQNKNLLEPSVKGFNEIYQSRLRLYNCDERQPGNILANIPDAQFGLVVAYNFFNFRPFEVIRRYLEEIHLKLKPGGMLLMTINDCDRDKAVMLVENNYCCYTPGALIESLANKVGFETVFKWSDEGPSTWLEFKKPGTLTTMRAGQTLAKIIPK